MFFYEVCFDIYTSRMRIDTVAYVLNFYIKQEKDISYINKLTKPTEQCENDATAKGLIVDDCTKTCEKQSNE